MTKLRFLVVSILIIPFFSHAIVDMRNANYSETWTDLEVTGSGFDLRVARTYNSRTIYNGMFGFGWCSDFETRLDITPENTIRVTECGAGLDVEYRPKNYSNASFDKVISSIMKEVRARNAGRDETYFKNLEAEIRRDSILRDEFARQLKISGDVSSGVTYFALGRTFESIVKTANGYTRTIQGGATQTFDKNGRLLGIKDANGNSLTLTYSGNTISRMADSSGNTLQFKYAPNAKYVVSITGPKGLTVSYKYEGEALKEVVNAWSSKYIYSYDDLYNLTKIAYPDKTSIEISYNKDKDWVTSFKDRDNCTETYVYSDNPKDKFNNYKSDVVKKCDGKITNQSNYEFWHASKKDGGRYLSRTKAIVNGVETDTEYHPDHGKPVLINRDGLVTRYEYYPNGQIKRRSETQRFSVYKYENSCNKVSEVSLTVSVPVPAQGRKPSKVSTKTLVTKFNYEPKTCNLDTAKNSDGQYAKLKYDRRGRITQIEDQTKKLVNIQYDERSNKPSVVTRPGLGSINFKYKASGEIEKVDSKDEPYVAVQVANMFSNLLEIIGPATTDNPI